MDAHLLVFLLPLIFLAGFVDSIAGGGGLISLTSYIAFGMNPHLALGNNKFASTSGTIVAATRYIKSGQINLKICIFAVIASLIGSSIGSSLVLQTSDVFLKYALMVVVPVLAAVTIFKKDFGTSKNIEEGAKVYILSFVISFIIGGYDGFFGPGTGMFLTFFFTSILGLDIKKACGNAKVINLASNIAALTVFIYNKNIDYAIGIPCAIAQIAGCYVGSGMAIKGGVKIVRPIMLLVLGMLLIKVGYELFF